MSVRVRLLGYHLTTAEITYHLPDYPDLLQNFIWQDLDMIPHLPALRKFLAYWQKSRWPTAFGQGRRVVIDQAGGISLRQRRVLVAIAGTARHRTLSCHGVAPVPVAT